MRSQTPAGFHCSPDKQEDRTIEGQIGNDKQGEETQWEPTQRLRGGWEYGAKTASDQRGRKKGLELRRLTATTTATIIIAAVN